METKTFKIYFSDLSEEAKLRLCDEFNTNEKEENWDIDLAPLVILERYIDVKESIWTGEIF